MERLSFDAFSGDPIDVVDLDFGECSYRPIIDDRGEIYFFLGVLQEEHQGELSDLYTLRSLHFGAEGKSRPKLVRISYGQLLRSFDIWGGADQTRQIKVLHNYIVRLPDGGANRIFGVVDRDSNQEHIELTHSIFGLSQRECDTFLHHFGRCLGNVDTYRGFPRTTASNTRDNWCDLSHRWIPERFPYITFAESDYFGSHVSLGGFYQLASFLCGSGRSSKIGGMLVDSGVEQQLLDRICRMPFMGYGEIRYLSY